MKPFHERDLKGAFEIAIRLRAAGGWPAEVRRLEHEDLTTRMGVPRGQARREVSADHDRRDFEGAVVFPDRSTRKNPELRKAIALRERLLTLASNELTTPLRALKRDGQSLLRLFERTEGMPRECEERASRMVQSVLRLERLAAALLDASRIDADKCRLHRHDVNVHDLVKAIVDDEREIAATAGCTIDVQLAGPARACVDRERFEQIVLNLLTNAIRYGTREPIELSVGGTDDELVVSVTDHGIGIAPEHHARIFGKFERAVPIDFGGLGLGLWIVDKLAAAHGGHVSVSSEEGAGATFVVTLPRQERDVRPNALGTGR